MALSVQKILLAGANVSTNQAGAFWQSANVTVNTAGANLNVVLAAGVYYANTPTNCAVYQNISGASNTIVLAANSAGLLLSDGVSMFANTTTNGTLVLCTVNGGANVTGTFLT